MFRLSLKTFPKKFKVYPDMSSINPTKFSNRHSFSVEIMSDIAERATRLLDTGNRMVIQEPLRQFQGVGDPLTFLLMLPFLPFFLIFQAIQGGGGTRRTAITEIERTTGGGWRIFEYER